MKIGYYTVKVTGIIINMSIDNNKTHETDRLLISDIDVEAQRNDIPERPTPEFMRKLAELCASYTVLWGPFSLAAGLTGWIKSLYSYLSFSGLSYCLLSNSEDEDQYYIYFYLSIVFIFAAVTFPSTFYEQFRKARKYAHYFGIGTATPNAPYAPSQGWLKWLNARLGIVGMLVTGWNIGTLFGRVKPESNHGFKCIAEGWQMSWTTIGIGLLGGAAFSFLGGWQVYSYLGKKKARLGDARTAVLNSVQKLASTLYPLIQKAAKNGLDTSSN
jgi:hypothetical protein